MKHLSHALAVQNNNNSSSSSSSRSAFGLDRRGKRTLPDNGYYLVKHICAPALNWLLVSGSAVFCRIVRFDLPLGEAAAPAPGRTVRTAHPLPHSHSSRTCHTAAAAGLFLFLSMHENFWTQVHAMGCDRDGLWHKIPGSLGEERKIGSGIQMAFCILLPLPLRSLFSLLLFPLCVSTVMIFRLLEPRNCNPHHDSTLQDDIPFPLFFYVCS